MACFVAPVAEAVITTVVSKVVKSKEKKEALMVNAESHVPNAKHIPFSTKMGWLNKMLWGGSALLAFEHIWHGEVIATFPFLTAVQNGEVSEMLMEIGTNGVLMCVLVTAVWGGMLIVSSILEKKADNISEVAGETN